MRDVTSPCNTKGSSCPDLGIPCPLGKELLCSVAPENHQEAYQQVLVLTLQICHILGYYTAKIKRGKKKIVTKIPAVIDVVKLIYGTCFRNYTGTTSCLALPELRCPHAPCRRRVGVHHGEEHAGQGQDKEGTEGCLTPQRMFLIWRP